MTEFCQSNIKCTCSKVNHSCRRVVITGGPGAGKTAVLEIARKSFCEHVSILPEAASILFGGGFWRHDTLPAKQAAQRAIFHVQRELEQMVEDERKAAIALCDRGTIDGLAYWPLEEDLYWKQVGSTKEYELKRYAAVIHLRTPALEQGYNFQNPVRTESAQQAALIDQRIFDVWKDHPRRITVNSTDDFLHKVEETIKLIKEELPECCKGHKIQGLTLNDERPTSS